MTGHNAPSQIGGSCAFPGCGSIVLLSTSQFCSRHQPRRSSSVASGVSPTTTTHARTPGLVDRGFTAKRGRGRFLLKSSGPGRSTVKSQLPAKPGGTSQGRPSTEAKTHGTASPTPKPDPGRPRSESIGQASSAIPENNNVDDPQNHASKPKPSAAPISDAAHAEPNGDVTKAVEDPPSDGMSFGVSDLHKLPTEAIESITDNTVKQSCVPKLAKKNPAPVTNMESEALSIRDSEAEAPTNERVHVSAHIRVSVTTEELPDIGIPDLPQELKASSELTTQQDVIPASPQKHNAEGRKEDRPSGPPPRKKRKPDSPIQQEGVKVTDAAPPESPLARSKIPSQQANDESLSSRVRSPPAQSIDLNVEDDDEANMADVSESSDDDEDPKPADTVMLPFRAKYEARRKKMLAAFDSAAFDACIYRQSDLRPPPGVVIPSRKTRKAKASSEEPRLFLPVNPAIHRMHNRSEDWYKKKCQEIKRRPRRKAWFGKVLERQRWLNAREAKLDEECEQARLAGKDPPFKPPQPRTHKRILDFGDVPEEELPEDVRNNPAWLKACAWHRETMNKALQRQHQVNKTTEETQRFFMEAFSELPL
ncbi:Hypothetical protein NCS54_00699500 [Fusarium falciforme]|uniref:Hypothetical protein n=1 Tax=Fusarium falciforme TaxID=195108 RepID=UPI002301E5F2|nr:Hypothetical protein NCS54_00699500 [Fusarium falciforme]WAO89599.1 Hypothetical protein NCS54_00699500 [Fusarium falciforme]